MDLMRTWSQYRTPNLIAEHLAAGLCTWASRHVHVLDPGAGDGVLGFAVALRMFDEGLAQEVTLTMVEAEPTMHERLVQRAAAMEQQHQGLRCVVATDFLLWRATEAPDIVVCNPPYGKISPDDERGGTATNLYVRFMLHALAQLAPGGRARFIVPRSFTSGPLFARARAELKRLAVLERVHLFDSRRVFDDVLQELLLVDYAVGSEPSPYVVVTSSRDGDDLGQARVLQVPRRLVEHDGAVWLPTTPEQLRVVAAGHGVKERLDSQRLQVSTGRVIPFRAREHLRREQEAGTVPLLWMQHVRNGQVSWPLGASFAKPEHVSRAATKLLVPAANYVLVRRVSAKEDARRIVAAPLMAGQFEAELLGLENHLNYITRPGMTSSEARELAEYLSSDMIDSYVRAGNGNTQISAAELLSLPWGLVWWDDYEFAASERASGDCVCQVCRKQYKHHPQAINAPMHRLCPGAWTRVCGHRGEVRWVKL